MCWVSILTPDLFAAAVRLATPLALAAIGGTICERSGVVNIALEGIMLDRRVLRDGGRARSPATPWVGVARRASSRAWLFAALHAFASINLRADQIVSGTAINILALGRDRLPHGGRSSGTRARPIRSRRCSRSSTSTRAGERASLGTVWHWIDTRVPQLHADRVHRHRSRDRSCTWAMYRTRWGLRLRALGEHPRAADTVGINVVRGRWVAVLISRRARRARRCEPHARAGRRRSPRT